MFGESLLVMRFGYFSDLSYHPVVLHRSNTVLYLILINTTAIANNFNGDSYIVNAIIDFMFQESLDYCERQIAP